MKRFLTHFKGKDFGFKELQLSEGALYTPLTAQQAKFAFYFTLKRHNKRGSYLPSHGIYGKSCKLTWETTETQGKLWGFFHRTGVVPLGLKFTDLPSSVVVQYGEKQHPVCMPGIHKILWKWSVCINTVLFGFTSSAFLYIWIVIFPSPCYGTHIWPLEPQHLDLGIWWLLWVPSSSGHSDSLASSQTQNPNSDLFPGPRELFRAILRSAHVWVCLLWHRPFGPSKEPRSSKPKLTYYLLLQPWPHNLS